MRRTRRRRRRGIYVPPLLLIFLTLAAASLLLLGSRYLRQDSVSVPGEERQPQGTADMREAAGEQAVYIRAELEEEAIYTGDLILVNNWTLYHFPGEQPLACVFDGKSGSYYVRDKEVFLAPAALEALNEMLDAFRTQGGSKTVNVVAGYRTEEFQQHLFDQSAQQNGEDHAQRFVAQPGGSEHHTGLAMDLSLFFADGSSAEYEGGGEYAWINQNCHNYGWVVRYDKAKEAVTGIGDEPWHFRYVGVPHATAMAERGLCLEEYIDYLKDFPCSGQHLTVDCADGLYEIWYCAGTTVYLPDSGEYTLSGNNVDGVVVTCKIE